MASVNDNDDSLSPALAAAPAALARCRTLGALVKVLIWHIIVAIVVQRALVRYGYGYEHMVLCEHNYSKSRLCTQQQKMKKTTRWLKLTTLELETSGIELKQ